MAHVILLGSVNVDYAPVRTIGPYVLASWLRQHKYSVKVIEYCHLMTPDELTSVIEAHIGPETVCIGASSTFWHRAYSTDSGIGDIVGGFHANEFLMEPDWLWDARERIERKYPRIEWVLGGANPERFYLLKYKWRIFTGFAEDSLLKYVKEKSSGKKVLIPPKPFDIRSCRNFYSDSDFLRHEEALNLELGRGCRFKCKFCAYPLIGKRPGTYERNLDFIREELIDNYERWGVTRYFMQDDTVNESVERIEQLAAVAQTLPFKLEWIGYLRLDLISAQPQTIQLLKDSGLKSAFFGIESFHPEAASCVGKGFNGKHGKEFLLRLKEEWGDDINWYMSLIVGLPGEPEEFIHESQEWMIKNDMPGWRFNPLTIDKRSPHQSEFSRNAEEYGYKFDDDIGFNWSNGLWTRQRASDVAFKLNRDSYTHRRFCGWHLMETAGIGYDINALMKERVFTHDNVGDKIKTRDIAREYVFKNLTVAFP